VPAEIKIGDGTAHDATDKFGIPRLDQGGANLIHQLI
jgi:hypothetical protein